MLTALMSDLAEMRGENTEAHRGIGRTLSRVDKVLEDQAQTQADQGKALTAIQQTCSTRGKRISDMTARISRNEETGQKVMASGQARDEKARVLWALLRIVIPLLAGGGAGAGLLSLLG